MPFLIRYNNKYLSYNLTFENSNDSCVFLTFVDTSAGMMIRFYPSNFIGLGFFKDKLVGINYESSYLLKFNKLAVNSEQVCFKISGTVHDKWLSVFNDKLIISETKSIFNIEEKSTISISSEIHTLSQFDLNSGTIGILEILHHHRAIFSIPITKESERSMLTIVESLPGISHGTKYLCKIEGKDPYDVMKFLNVLSHKDLDRFNRNKRYFCIRIRVNNKAFDIIREPLTSEITELKLRRFYTERVNLFKQILERYSSELTINIEIHDGKDFYDEDPKTKKQKIRSVLLVKLKSEFLKEYRQIKSQEEIPALKQKYKVLFERISNET